MKQLNAKNKHKKSAWNRSWLNVWCVLALKPLFSLNNNVKLLLTKCSWAPLEKSGVLDLIKSFPEIYGTRSFITVSQKPRTGLYFKLDQSSTYNCSVSLRSISVHPRTHVFFFLLVFCLQIFSPISNRYFSPKSRHTNCISNPSWLGHYY